MRLVWGYQAYKVRVVRVVRVDPRDQPESGYREYRDRVVRRGQMAQQGLRDRRVRLAPRELRVWVSLAFKVQAGLRGLRVILDRVDQRVLLALRVRGLMALRDRLALRDQLVWDCLVCKDRVDQPGRPARLERPAPLD